MEVKGWVFATVQYNIQDAQRNYAVAIEILAVDRMLIH